MPLLAFSAEPLAVGDGRLGPAVRVMLSAQAVPKSSRFKTQASNLNPSIALNVDFNLFPFKVVNTAGVLHLEFETLAAHSGV